MSQIMNVQTGIRYYQPRISVKEQEKKTQNSAASSADEERETLLSQLKQQEEAREKAQAQMMQAAMGKSNQKVSVSTGSQNSVGQLATMLANAQNTMDVQQVISKAMLSMAGLKIAQPLAEGKQRDKITAQIRRLEKLLTRSRGKIRHLNKEAELERKQRKAERAQEEQKARARREELKSRRNKRRRDEARYAQREVAKDSQESQEAMFESLAGAGGGSVPAAAPVAAAPVASAPVAAEVSSGADMAASEAAVVSMDISA